MKQHFLLAIITISLFASCSSAYKSSQTPDDVYYSPTREIKEEYKKEDDQQQYATNDDNYLHMKVHHYYRWSVIDDYSYWNDTRYDYQCSSYGSFYSPYSYIGWNPHYYGNSWYNPYYTLIPYKNPTVYIGHTTASNILAYKNKNYSNSNAYYNPKIGSSNNSSNGFGSLVKKAFSTNNGSTNSWDRPVRTFDNPTRTSTSSSSSSSTSSSAGGNSGGFNSTGSSSSSGRGGRN